MGTSKSVSKGLLGVLDVEKTLKLAVGYMCLQKDMPGGGHSGFVDDSSDPGERSGGPELGQGCSG